MAKPVGSADPSPCTAAGLGQAAFRTRALTEPLRSSAVRRSFERHPGQATGEGGGRPPGRGDELATMEATYADGVDADPTSWTRYQQFNTAFAPDDANDCVGPARCAGPMPRLRVASVRATPKPIQWRCPRSLPSSCRAWARRRGSAEARRTCSAARRPCGLLLNRLIFSNMPGTTVLLRRSTTRPSYRRGYPAPTVPPLSSTPADGISSGRDSTGRSSSP
jgi:hypothetical protein